MNVLNFKFLFLTFPAEAPILRREIHFNSLKSFRNLSWFGSVESIFYLHIQLHHIFGTSLKFLLTPLAEYTRHLRVADGIG